MYSRHNMAKFQVVNSNSESGDDDENDEFVDTWVNGGSVDKQTCKEEMEKNVCLIRDFADGLEYQVQFQDPQFLRTLEKEGAKFLKLARDCLSRERHLNSSRVASPATWESSTSNGLFYRSRPPRRDHNT